MTPPGPVLASMEDPRSEAIIVVTGFHWWHRVAVIVPMFVGATVTDAGTPETLQNQAQQTLQSPNQHPERYWTEERMRNAKPFPLPRAIDQSNDRPPPLPERGPIESAPAAPPLSPER